MNFNKVILAGHLAAHPQHEFVRYDGGKFEKCSLYVAVNRRWKNDDGSTGEEVSFVNVEVFGSRAGTITRFFSKGDPIHIEGHLKEDRWESKDQEGKDGKPLKRSRLYVVMDNFQFVLPKSARGERGSPGGDDSSDAQESPPEAAAAPAAAPAPAPATSGLGASSNPPPAQQDAFARDKRQGVGGGDEVF